MGFETIVRPAVFPNIRPAPARLSLPGDAPDKGVATLGGSGGGVIDLPWSESFSMSRGHHETKRTFEKVRMPYTNPDGTLDWSHYIEFEIATKFEFSPSFDLNFDPPHEADNLHLLGSETRAVPDVGF